MRRALVLSSGGAKASWQVGACEHLIVERRYWFDVIAGVSAGAVNGTTLAQAQDPKELETELEHLRSVWFALRDSHVYRWRWRGALEMALGKRASLYDTGPLRRVLEEHIDPPRVASSPIRLRVGYVDLLSGQYRTAANDHPALRDAVLASCSLPLVFPPVPLANGQELGVDGAVRRSTPLTDALDALAERPQSGDEPDEVWAVIPDPPGRSGPLDLIPEPPVHSWLGLALHSLWRSTGDGFVEEIQRLEETRVSSRRVKLRVLHPPNELRGGSLRFDPGKLRAWYEDGRRTAREVSSRPDPRAGEAHMAPKGCALTAPLGWLDRSGSSPV
jgi:predicted acylesterase/phospholipase RssA